MREAGFSESSDYLQDILYDNVQLVKEDEIGIVVDLRTREDYLEHISGILVKAEKLRDKGNCNHIYWRDESQDSREGSVFNYK